MFSYQAFGLSLQSDFAFPELSPAPAGASHDIKVTLKELGLIAGAVVPFHHFSKERQTFVYPGVGAFIVNGLDEIVVEPAPGAGASLIALPLLGPVMGLLLHLRGRFVLHGSAVGIAGNGFGFLGDKGAGKSTLAAALLRQDGASLLSDDLLTFDDEGRIFPAFPQMKLSSDAIRMSEGVNATLMPAPIEGFPKQQIRLAGEMSTTPVQARALFELRRDRQPRLEITTAADSLKILLRYAYVGRFASRQMVSGEHHRLFSQAARLANTLKIGRLYVPDRLEDLPQVAALLENMRR